MTEYNLNSIYPGWTDYELHCTTWFLIWCTAEDEHFTKMIVKINDNSSEYKFLLTEDNTATPKEYDLRKTLGHELFHTMGVDHNSSSSSIVFHTYEFGATKGYIATTTDKNDLGARYP